ncbi:helix-turn-helix domain-containing protein [Steroidobacter flavus]|uniref:Helix-turn-helix domain-containing protein n=1 Tax=Steroidobacter flavus TaxID=1842136 RepID=A0ABV8T0S8_9GAMM
MTELVIHDLLDTQTVAIRDVICDGKCRHKSPEECPNSTYLVFPYRGVYMRHLGSNEAVAEANQVLFFNQRESYRISHPVQGGDACLSISVREDLLRELAPVEHLQDNAAVMFSKQRWRIDPRAQVLVALLRHTLLNKSIELLEAETLTLTLIRRALGERTSQTKRATYGRQKLVDRAKLILSSELSRRWTLTEIAAEVGVSPVYLTQAFAQVEGVPLYRYQLRLRLARALDLLGSYDDLSTLGVDLGFSSHSHFTAAFRQAYGRTPAQFQRSANLR